MLYSSEPAEPDSLSSRFSTRSNCAVVSTGTTTVVTASPVASSSTAGSSRRASITWKIGVRAEIALGSELVDEMLERHVLVRVGLECRVRTRPSSSSNVGFPERSTRSGRVFTKKPTTPSSSGAVRFATGKPTTTSSWPECRARTASNAASSVMNSVARSPATDGAQLLHQRAGHGHGHG